MHEAEHLVTDVQVICLSFPGNCGSCILSICPLSGWSSWFPEVFLWRWLSLSHQSRRDNSLPSPKVLAEMWLGLRAGRAGVVSSDNLAITHESRPALMPPLPRSFPWSSQLEWPLSTYCQGAALWVSQSASCQWVTRRGRRNCWRASWKLWNLHPRRGAWWCPFSKLGLC